MKSGLLFIYLICWSAILWGQVRLDSLEQYDLQNNTWLLKEGQQPLTIQQAWSLYARKGFRKIHAADNEVNLGFVKDIYWVAIPVDNAGMKRPYEAGIANGGIFGLQYFQVDQDGKVVAQYATGECTPFNSRAIPDRHFYFPLQIPERGKAVIFFRVNMVGTGFFLPLRIITPERRRQQELNIYLIYLYFCGFLSFVAFFSLAAFFWAQDRVYLYYACYIMCYCLFFLSDGDLDYELLYPRWPGLAVITPVIYGLGINFFMLLFMLRFLHLKPGYPRFYRFTGAWTWLLVLEAGLITYAYVFSAATPLRRGVYILGAVCVIGSWVIQIWGIILRLRDRYKPAYLYGIALLCVFLTVIIYVSHSFAMIPLIIPSWLYVAVGFSAEIFVLTIALMYSFNFYKTGHQQLTLHLARQQLDFSMQLLQIQEAEQKRIAQDLHDELGGGLAAIKMNILGLRHEDTAHVVALVDRAVLATRSIAHNLMPPEFEQTNLQVLLRDHFERLNLSGKISFTFYMSPGDIPLSKQDQLLIYRIVMELSSNVIRHSGATESVTQLIMDELYMDIMCEDNGKGFDPVSNHGIGLRSIQSRVNFLNGSLHIDSGNHGSTILIKVPLKKYAPHE